MRNQMAKTIQPNMMNKWEIWWTIQQNSLHVENKFGFTKWFKWKIHSKILHLWKFAWHCRSNISIQWYDFSLAEISIILSYIVIDGNSIPLFDFFENNHQHKILIFVSAYLVYLNWQSSKNYEERNSVMYWLIIAYIKELMYVSHTETYNFSQVWKTKLTNMSILSILYYLQKSRIKMYHA